MCQYDSELGVTTDPPDPPGSEIVEGFLCRQIHVSLLLCSGRMLTGGCLSLVAIVLLYDKPSGSIGKNNDCHRCTDIYSDAILLAREPGAQGQGDGIDWVSC